MVLPSGYRDALYQIHSLQQQLTPAAETNLQHSGNVFPKEVAGIMHVIANYAMKPRRLKDKSSNLFFIPALGCSPQKSTHIGMNPTTWEYLKNLTPPIAAIPAKGQRFRNSRMPFPLSFP